MEKSQSNVVTTHTHTHTHIYILHCFMNSSVNKLNIQICCMLYNCKESSLSLKMTQSMILNITLKRYDIRINKNYTLTTHTNIYIYIYAFVCLSVCIYTKIIV